MENHSRHHANAGKPGGWLSMVGPTLQMLLVIAVRGVAAIGLPVLGIYNLTKYYQHDGDRLLPRSRQSQSDDGGRSHIGKLPARRRMPQGRNYSVPPQRGRISQLPETGHHPLWRNLLHR